MSSSESVVNEVTEIINTQYTEYPTLAQLLKTLGYDRNQVIRYFREEGQSPPGKHLRNLRLKGLKQEVTQTRTPFKDIAVKYNIKDTDCLAFIYKTAYGVTPKLDRLNSTLDTNILSFKELDIPELLKEEIDNLEFRVINPLKLSKQFNVAYSYLNMLFRKRYGKSLKVYQKDKFFEWLDEKIKEYGISYEEALAKAKFFSYQGFFNNCKKYFGSGFDEYHKKHSVGVKLTIHGNRKWVTPKFAGELFQNLMDNFLEEGLTIDELRKIYGIDLLGWNRLFNDLFGVPSITVVKRLKIVTLMRLIDDYPDKPLNKLVKKVYRNSPSHGNAVFRELTGITTQEYRDKKHFNWTFNPDLYKEIVNDHYK